MSFEKLVAGNMAYAGALAQSGTIVANPNSATQTLLASSERSKVIRKTPIKSNLDSTDQKQAIPFAMTLLVLAVVFAVILGCMHVSA